MAASIGNMFDVMLTNLFQSFNTTGETSSLSFREFLTLVKRNKHFSSKTEENSYLVSHVHQCLQASKQRYEGLLLLDVIIQQCGTAVFHQYALTWLKLLTNILQGHCISQVYSSCCKVLARVISHSPSFSDIAREVTNSGIPQLLPLLLASSSECLPAALGCVNTCIEKYPGPVGPFKTKLQTLLVRELDLGNGFKELSRCFALLAQCGPGGTHGIKHTEAWSEQMDGLLAGLHASLDGLYADLEIETSQPYQGRTLSGLGDIDFSQPDRVAALVARWRSLTCCLQHLLREEFPAVVKVPTEDILQLVLRCLSVNIIMLMRRETSERCLLAGHVQELHVHALHVLQALIQLCRCNLLPHVGVIIGVLTQELTWSHTVCDGQENNYSYLREAVYQTLNVWMQTLDGSSGVESGEATLVKEILHDCLPFTDTLKISSTSTSADQGVPASSKKAKKRRGYQEISQGISSQRKIQPLANVGLVRAALETLHWMLTSSGSELSQKSAQSVLDFTIRTLLALQQSPVPPAPYADFHCRRGLYRALGACVIMPHPQLPSPLQCTLGIFSGGLRDKHVEVSSYCIEAMRMCETLIHPRVPCLNGPVICGTLINIGLAANTGDRGKGLNGAGLNGREMAVNDKGDNVHSRMDHIVGDRENANKTNGVGRLMIEPMISINIEGQNEGGKRKRDEDVGGSDPLTPSKKQHTQLSKMTNDVAVVDISDDDDDDSEDDNEDYTVIEKQMSERNVTDNLNAEKVSETGMTKTQHAENGESFEVIDDEEVAGLSTGLGVAVVNVSSDDDDKREKEKEEGDVEKEKQEPTADLRNMLDSFVDVGPDSE
ncbi:PELP1-like protein [Mya arenaria]|uniref:PELP1-like protein n=1 Tax=Mya arenaria TaxID=6604 RepID=A0ABY7G2B7_MYAAR|nr:proline-, glutamic acid- and leucine-rich protein 1-like [Mya arenaria]WAR28582.1 PELP1-like protein [Mya arenaria]